MCEQYLAESGSFVRTVPEVHRAKPLALWVVCIHGLLRDNSAQKLQPICLVTPITAPAGLIPYASNTA